MVTSDEVRIGVEAGLAAIRAAFGSAEAEHGVTLFVTHHLEELPSSYWESNLDDSNPQPSKVLELLEVHPQWDPAEDGIDSIDFTLPGEVTDSLICVSFDEDGSVSGIEMES